eukprot:CAMPEP_0201549530 /NCGR_PEP_ID=MMETSP0173_2-20130828/5986_1 /ASSEMBLY_ACC=CAM_ASM_000268 /TAXON_ID=218659 /ORGANISM="Vexillifera sp., Strain DIVA3 564/2" /LENGTH=485 /DNA_ID=CAMNT_0047959225 /DNA_START=27 /DNA_END=1484 /DNA_ORIENTATION=-
MSDSDSASFGSPVVINRKKDWQQPHRLTRTKTQVILIDAPAYTERSAEVEAIARKESMLFGVFTLIFQAILIVLHALWTDYLDGVEAIENVETYYSYFRDVLTMVLIGFGCLMCFLRRYGFGAIGYTMYISVLVIQWSIILGFFFESVHHGGFAGRKQISLEKMLDSLFCAATVLISYGAFLGKVTPLQVFFLVVIEPFFFWLNFYIGSLLLEVVDIGGGLFIHMFGCYFGLAVTWWLTSREKTSAHPDNTSAYTSDLFSLIGTLFLWIMWPSFNAAIASPGEERLNAVINTVLALCGATVATFTASRFTSESGSKFEVAHIQNATLAGGVSMGVIGHLPIFPAAAIGTGFVAGLVSTLGYVHLTPILNNRLRVQDICGVHNLHGIPGIIATIASAFAIYAIDGDYANGDNQPGYQILVMVITLGISIASGFLCGAVMRFTNPDHVRRVDFFNDRPFFHLPSDYEMVGASISTSTVEKSKATTSV